MLSMELFRSNPGMIRASEKKRGKDQKNVDAVIKLDNEWRAILQKTEKLKAKRNIVSREIAELKKAGKSGHAKIAEMKKINNEIGKNDTKQSGLLEERDKIRYSIGNVLHEAVPSGNSEEENVPIRFWGKPKVFKTDIINFRKLSMGKMKPHELDRRPQSHVDLLQKLDLADLEKASVLSGARFYYLKNELVTLNLALIRFAMDSLSKEGFTLFWTPFILGRKPIERAAELADFQNQLYKIEGEDSYLIATAEQPLAAYHMDETLKEEELPKLYAGFSTNFRKEAGSHGKDTKGIFRVHQFDKVEQFAFSRPEDSWKMMDRLMGNSERIYQRLEIPYRVVEICSGQMNDNAARKMDIEAWMPAQGAFREVVSCSNCTDYQARKLNVRLLRKSGDKDFPHLLNATAIATERTIVAILENHQNHDGSVSIPAALQHYTGFSEIRGEKHGNKH